MKNKIFINKNNKPKNNNQKVFNIKENEHLDLVNENINNDLNIREKINLLLQLLLNLLVSYLLQKAKLYLLKLFLYQVYILH